MIAIGIVVIVAIAAVAVYAVTSDDDDNDKKIDYTGADVKDIRVRVYGNANGDDVIDETDKAIIERIVAWNNDDDTTNDIDWETTYPYADANHDGKVTQDDVTYVQNFIDGKSQKMYYTNFFENVTYVNFPIGHKIGAEYTVVDMLSAIKHYNYFTATDTTTPAYYGDNKYPGITSLYKIGDWRGFTVENLTSAYENGHINSLLQWTGGQNTNYLWDMMHDSGLADKISLVMLPCQGPRCIEGALTLAVMLNDPDSAKDYKAWYEKAMDTVINKIDAANKKTITCVRAYDETTEETIAAFGSEQRPALWFTQIVNFQSQYIGKTNFTKIGLEGFADTATSEVIAMTQRSADFKPSEYNDYVKERLSSIYGQTDQFKNEKIYVIDFEIMPFYGGPAGCYILAADLYPDQFNMEDALNFLQEYLDEFSPVQGADARQGYTYTGTGYASA